MSETDKEQLMEYLVCENRHWRNNRAVVHISGRCYSQRRPGNRIAYSQWFGPCESLDAAISKAEAAGRTVRKCGICFRPGPFVNLRKPL